MAHLIVCERSPHWAVAFRRQLRGRSIEVEETRSIDQCGEALCRAPHSVFALEIGPADWNPRVRWLWSTSHAFANARAIVLASRGMEQADWLFREAGAAWVAYSTRNTAVMTRFVRQCLGPKSASRPEFPERIWERLPWAQVATKRESD